MNYLTLLFKNTYVSLLPIEIIVSILNTLTYEELFNIFFSNTLIKLLLGEKIFKLKTSNKFLIPESGNIIKLPFHTNNHYIISYDEIKDIIEPIHYKSLTLYTGIEEFLDVSMIGYEIYGNVYIVALGITTTSLDNLYSYPILSKNEEWHIPFGFRNIEIDYPYRLIVPINQYINLIIMTLLVKKLFFKNIKYCNQSNIPPLIKHDRGSGILYKY